MTGLSIVQPTYNQPEQLRLILEGYANQCERAGAFEVVVCNDGGERDSVAEVVDEYRHRLDLKSLFVDPPSQKMRLNKARNVGLHAAKYPRLLLNDGDCIPGRSLVATHQAYADRFVAVQSERKNIPRGRLPTLADVSAHKLDGWEYALHTRFANEPAMQGTIIPRHCWGYSASYPTALVHALGGWWERMTGHDGNDAELNNRLARLGLPFQFDRRAVVWHLGHESRRTEHDTECVRRWQFHSNQTVTLFRNHKAINRERGFWMDWPDYIYDPKLAGAIVQLIGGLPAYDFGCGDGRLCAELSKLARFSESTETQTRQQ